MKPDLEILSDDPRAPENRSLIDALDAYLFGLYPAESNHLLSIEALRQAGVLFLTAKQQGSSIGCCAAVPHLDYVEIKRMFVRPDCRGGRIGSKLLEAVEQRCAAEGFALARLETGIRQPEALALYGRAGYTLRPPFGDYQEDPLSVFMEKRLIPD